MTNLHRRASLVLASACLSSPLYGQGIAIHDNVTTAAKNVPSGAQAPVYTVPFAQITVCDATCANPAPIYSDLGLTQPITQPLIADSQGRFSYYIAPGTYYEQIATPSGQNLATIPVELQGVVGQLVSSPAFGQTITQPAGTTFSVNSFDNIIYPLYTGRDFGIDVNNAVARLPASGCGAIALGPVDYNYATEIQVPRCTQFYGNGAHLHWTGTDPSIPAFVKGSLPIGQIQLSSYQGGSIRDLTITNDSGNPLTAGLFLGGASGLVGAAAAINNPNSLLGHPDPNLGDALEQIENVQVSGFTAGLMIGNEVFQDTFPSDIWNNNTEGVYAATSFGSENMNFSGNQILNNSDHGFYAPSALGSKYVFSNTSCDYNLHGCDYSTQGYTHWHDPYMEQTNGAYFFDGPDVVNASDLGSKSLVVDGGATFVAGGTTAYGGIARAQGHNSRVHFGDGIDIYRPNGAVVPALVNWQVSGSSSEFRSGTVWDGGSNPGIPAISIYGGIINGQQVLPPAYSDYPVYAQYTQTDRHMSALSVASATMGASDGSGYVGATNNLNGVLPAIGTAGPFPFNGNFLAWNGAGPGDADYFNPFSDATQSDTAFAWYANLAGTWNKVMSVERGGTVDITAVQTNTLGLMAGPTIKAGSGAPPTACPAANVSGSLWLRTDSAAGANTTLYVCTATSGWVAK